MRPRYLVYILLLLPAFLFRDYTPDNELRYISIVEEALQNHTWLTFYNHGIAYADKPPLYFWLIMLGRVVLGSYPMWFLGLLSLVPAAGILAVMDRWLGQEKTDLNPWTANALLGTTGMFLGSALVLRMDMLMALFIVLSLYTFYRLYRGTARPGERWLLPLYIFLGIFTKGAMGLLIPLVSMAAFLLVKKRIRTFGRYFGWKPFLLLLGLCTVWFSLVYLEGGSAYLNNILFKQTVGRGINAFHHKEPFYYYLQNYVFTFAPWSLFYLAVLAGAAWKRLLRTDLERFFLTVVLASLALLSLISSKLDIYLLPIYPFAAYLTALLLPRMKEWRTVRLSILVPAGLITLLFPASFFLLSRIPYPYHNLWAPYFGLFLLSAGGAAAVVSVWRKQLDRAVVSLAGGILALVCVASFGLKQFNPYIGYGAMADKARQVAGQHGAGRYAFYRFVNAEHMDVYLGQKLMRVDSVPQLDTLGTAGRTVLLIRGRELRREERLQEWLSGREVTPFGDYHIVVLGRE